MIDTEEQIRTARREAAKALEELQVIAIHYTQMVVLHETIREKATEERQKQLKEQRRIIGGQLAAAAVNYGRRA